MQASARTCALSSVIAHGLRMGAKGETVRQLSAMARRIGTALPIGARVSAQSRKRENNGDVLRVTHDSDSESDSPLEWGWDVVAYVHRSGYGMTLPDCEGSGDPIAYAFAYYVDNARRGDDEDYPLARAMRYARTFYADNRVAKLVSLQGYSQSDWAEIVFIGPDAETVNFIAEDYGYYFRGDVWSVASDNDAIGGIYADSAEEAATDYLENYYEYEE